MMETQTGWRHVPLGDTAERVERILAETDQTAKRLTPAIKALRKRRDNLDDGGRTVLPPGGTPALTRKSSTPNFSLLELQGGLLKNLAIYLKSEAYVSDGYAMAGALFILAALTENKFRLIHKRTSSAHGALSTYLLLIGPARKARKSWLMEASVQGLVEEVTGQGFIDECTGPAIHEELCRSPKKSESFYFDEFRALVGDKPGYAAHLDTLITKMYNGQRWTRSLKTNAKKLGDSTRRTVENFMVNVCGCSTPAWLFKHITRDSFLSGFMLRFIPVYLHEEDPAAMLNVDSQEERTRFLAGLPMINAKKIKRRLTEFYEELHGDFRKQQMLTLSVEASALLSDFATEICQRNSDELEQAIFDGLKENIRRVAALIEISHLLDSERIVRRSVLEVSPESMTDALRFFRQIYPDALKMVREHFFDSRLEGDAKALLKVILTLRPKMKRYEAEGQSFKALTKTEITRHTRLTGNTREAALRELVARDIVDGPITLPSPNRRARKPLQVYVVKRNRWEAASIDHSEAAMEDEAPGRSSSLPPPRQRLPTDQSSPMRQVMDSDCWGTPRCLFDALNKEFRFTLDVCASDKNAKCGDYFTEADDGLRQSWEEHSCWCNPPYSDPMPWVKKAVEAQKLGATVVMLVRDDCSTAWFDLARQHACEIRHLQGRLRFDHPAGDTAKPGRATFSSVLFIFRPDVAPNPQGPVHRYLDYRALEAAPSTCK